MQKKIAGLILRPSPARDAEGRRVMRFRPVQHRRESREPLPVTGALRRREAEDAFYQLAHDWLYAKYGGDVGYPDYPEDGLATYLATSTAVGEQVPDSSDYVAVLIATTHYADERREWARRSRFPLVIHWGGQFRRNPPPRQFDIRRHPVFRYALAILEDAGARPMPRRLEA